MTPTSASLQLTQGTNAEEEIYSQVNKNHQTLGKQTYPLSTRIEVYAQIAQLRGETEEGKSAQCELNMEVINLQPQKVSNKNLSLAQEE